MILGIVSDTHSFFHPNLKTYLDGVDVILHAGDIGTPEIITELETIAPTKAVWGNIDGALLRRMYPENQFLELGGCKIWMTHIGGHPKRWAKGIEQALFEHKPDIFICGHSHILRIERVPYHRNMLYLNPGAAGRYGFHKVKTCVRLTLENGKAIQAEVVHLDEKTDIVTP